MPCAVRSWKRLSGLALRSSRPRRPPTRCSPTSRRRPPRRRCARRCPCWVSKMSRFDDDERRRTRGPRRLGGADRRRGRHRRQPAAAIARRVHRPAPGARAAAAGHRRRQEPRRHTGSHPAVGPARPGQDVAGDDHRRRTGLVAAGHLGSRAGTRGRSGRDAVQPRRGRRAVHRRDPPHRPARRGDAVPGDGGLPRRRRRRQRPWRDVDSARGRAVHPGRRDHPVGRADRAAARPVRLHRAHGLLRARRTGAGAVAFGGHPRHRARRRSRRRDRPPLPGHAAHRQPAAAPGARLRRGPRRRRDHPRHREVMRWRSTTSTSSAWTGSTAPSCRR